jgi:WD40 repeat protein
MFGSGRPQTGAFSPDGQRMALVGTFGVQVYDLAAPDIPNTLGGLIFPASDLAFSPDGRYLAVVGGYAVYMYDLNSDGEPNVVYPDESRGPLGAVAFHPDGTQLAVGSYSDVGRILILDPQTLSTIQFLDYFTDSITALAYDREGGILAAGSRDNTIALLDSTAEYAVIERISRNLAPITDFAFATDRLYVSSLDGTLNTYSLPDTTFIETVYTVPHPILTLIAAPDEILYIGESVTQQDGTASGSVTRMNMTSGMVDPFTTTAHRLPVTGLDVSPDGSRLLSVSGDFANLSDTVSRNGFGFPFMESVYTLAITAGGGDVALAGSLALGSFYSTSGALYANFFTDEAPVRMIAYDQTGGSLIVGADAARVYFVGGDGAPLLTLTDVPAALTAAQFSPDNTLIALGFADGTLRLYDFDDLRVQAEMTLHGDAITALDFSPDGARLLTASRDAIVLLWEIPSLTVLSSLTGHTNAVLSVQFSPDGTRAVTGGADGIAQVWDIDSQTVLFPLPDHYGAVTATRYSPDGLLILTTSLDGVGRLYDATTGAQLSLFYDHNAPIYDGVWLPDGVGFITGGGDGFAILYEIVR